MSEEPPVTMSEMHTAGYCAKGQRRWLNERMPEWRQYIETGMPMEVFEKLHPAAAAHVRRIRKSSDG